MKKHLLFIIIITISLFTLGCDKTENENIPVQTFLEEKEIAGAYISNNIFYIENSLIGEGKLTFEDIYKIGYSIDYLDDSVYITKESNSTNYEYLNFGNKTFVNTSGSDYSNYVGQLSEESSKLNVDTFDLDIENLSEFLWKKNMTYIDKETGQLSGRNNSKFSSFLLKKNNEIVFNILSWRKTFDTDIVRAVQLNSILEIINSMTEDKQFAYAVFSYLDYYSIYGDTDFNSFGIESKVLDEIYELSYKESSQVIYMKFNTDGVDIIKKNE